VSIAIASKKCERETAAAKQSRTFGQSMASQTSCIAIGAIIGGCGGLNFGRKHDDGDSATAPVAIIATAAMHLKAAMIFALCIFLSKCKRKQKPQQMWRSVGDDIPWMVSTLAHWRTGSLASLAWLARAAEKQVVGSCVLLTQREGDPSAKR
jgi:hypothetical protein